MALKASMLSAGSFMENRFLDEYFLASSERNLVMSIGEELL